MLGVGAAISICRETDFIRITLLTSDVNMANNGLGVKKESIGSGEGKYHNVILDFLGDFIGTLFILLKCMGYGLLITLLLSIWSFYG